MNDLRPDSLGLNADNEIEEELENESNKPVGFNDLMTVMQGAKFKGVDYGFENYAQNQSSSISEPKCDELIKNELSSKIIKYTNHFMVKVYPAYYRQDSSNLDPIKYWIYGFQIAALNFQTDDNSIKLNEALFNDNGNCGYVLKPLILRNNNNSTNQFDPLDINTMNNNKKLSITIISGQQLPKNKSTFKTDISDPYVSVEIIGIPFDECEEKTKEVKDNGHNPIWNETFHFTINCPDLCFLKFSVKDKDTGKDQKIGYKIIRFDSLKTG